MTNNNKYIKQQYTDSYIDVYLSIAIFIFILIIRDVFSIRMNKYMFVTIFAIDALLMQKKHLDKVLYFILPILNGLPGNYLIMIYLLRYFLEKGEFIVDIKTFLYVLLMLLISVYQMVVFSYSYLPVAFSGIGLVFFAVLLLDKTSDVENLYYYIFGTTVMSIIFIMATLRVYSLSDLLVIGKRLGDETVMYNEMGTMNIRMDPNYLGLFAITACALYFILMRKQLIEQNYMKVFMTISVAICSTIALIGLSRAYAITYCLMIFVIVFIQKKAKYIFFIIIGLGVCLLILNRYLSDVLDSLYILFASDSDLLAGNGRIDINKVNFAIWSKSIINMILGIGLFNCEVHCMPLQYIFGGGILYSIFLLLYAYNITKSRRVQFDLIDLLPFAFTFMMSCTVPLAASITYMTPVAISLFGYIIMADTPSNKMLAGCSYNM